MTIHQTGAATGWRAALLAGPWPAALAWGAALILTALGAGAVVLPDATSASLIIGIGAAALGLGGLGWGVGVLRTGRLLAPRSTTAGALLTMLVATSLLVSEPAHTSIVGVSVCVALSAALGACAAAAARSNTPAQHLRVGQLLAAAALIAVLVTPALGAVQDGVLLRDDGTVPVVPHH
ncbi:hypothetical protein [Microbacterium sp. Clip185]|uniref:hypothetical protein n=1 Tax=Microbacterium sp. Clip185 TaxID=3025663 RepID=UPI00236675FE|nr:hypothetical protein [Microbacterium sp. Clip185]WDG16770.1 hypothetical protein PQV94_08910 [Microbacterium sp. Clip185]